jgi:hypothetical protein
MTLESNHEPHDPATREAIRRHLRLGWWMLLGFLVLGTLLEAMHGLKIGWYLNVSNETRRLLLTLAHAHGVLLGLVNIAFAATLGLLPSVPENRLRLASTCLLAASVLLPGGFLLGGLTIYGPDPGPGIFLLPVGAAFLFVAALVTALATNTLRKADDQ